jgi:hypothetical protein
VYTHTKTVTNKSNSTNKSSATTLVKDYLYCVNSSAELFQIDPLNGKLTYLSDMPMGSVTCAIDQPINACILWEIAYPLMKYSIATNSWKTIKDI